MAIAERLDQFMRNTHINRRTAITGAVGATGVATAVGLLYEYGYLQGDKLSGERDRILALDPLSDARGKKEQMYAKKAQTLDDIDRGFWVIANVSARQVLLDKRWNLRENGQDSRLSPLDSKQKEWAQKHGMQPEVLATSLDAYRIARPLIQSLRYQLRPGLALEEKENGVSVSVDDFMINPGGMAMLAQYETHGFTQIGTARAVTQYNKGGNPNREKELVQYAKKLSEITGHYFDPKKMVGSKRSGSGEGGAIGGLQIEPENLNELATLLAKTGYAYNAVDLTSSMVGAYVFLAMEKWFWKDENGAIGADVSNRDSNDPTIDRDRIAKRFGYRRGDSQVIAYALAKWNDLPDEGKTVYDAAVDYYDTFIEPPSDTEQKPHVSGERLDHPIVYYQRDYPYGEFICGIATSAEINASFGKSKYADIDATTKEFIRRGLFDPDNLNDGTLFRDALKTFYRDQGYEVFEIFDILDENPQAHTISREDIETMEKLARQGYAVVLSGLMEVNDPHDLVHGKISQANHILWGTRFNADTRIMTAVDSWPGAVDEQRDIDSISVPFYAYAVRPK